MCPRSGVVALRVAGVITLLAALASPALALPPAPADQAPTMRACCAFGYNLAPKIGTIEFPIRIGNVSASRPFGKHSYAGALRIDERNAHLYTCGGGFVDLAHVRDNADWTGYLLTQTEAMLGSGQVLELPGEAGPRRLIFPARSLPGDREELVRLVARRIALDLSVWHEIASWYGFSLVPIFPERLSAFSPEDFYSNVMGTEIGLAAYLSPKPFDDAVEAGIIAATQALDPVPGSSTRRAFQMVDGLWWDSRRFVPDTDLVTRRYLDVGPVVTPWRVPGANAALCEGRNEPAVPRVAPEKAPDGEPLTNFYRLELDPDTQLMRGTPFPALAIERITSLDFGWIIATIRDQMVSELGPDFESPDAPHRPRPAPVASASAGDEGSPVSDPATSAEAAAGAPVSTSEAASGSCGSSDPICRIQMEGRVAGFHLLDLKVNVGASVNDDGRLAGGGEIRVLDADIPGGDIRAFIFDVNDDRGRRDLVARFVVAQSDAVYFCRDQESDELHPPLAAWFRACKPGGIWGLGGSVGEFQYDGATGRSAIRAFEFDAVANAFGNANTRDYLTKRLLPYVGVSLESVWPGTVPEEDAGSTASARPETDVSPRAVVGIRGLARTRDMRWEMQAYTGYRQDLSEASDQNFEAGLKLFRHFPLGLTAPVREDTEAGRPSNTEARGWSLFSVGLEAGYSYWSKPENQIQGWVGPFVSDRTPRTWQALVTMRWRPGELTF
ncbi:MAG: DUF4056 domain-containing protein [Deltaproteobacteria bacterium]|nr:DUF4056 domain-containing protein [Deltaproteobacteria bacterium]